MVRKSQREAVQRQSLAAVSARRAEELKRTADKGLRQKDLEAVIAHLQGLRANVRIDVDKTVDRKVKGKLTPEQASEIMGEGNYFGPEAVKKAFGITLTADQIPQIPFSKVELERAKSLGQMLVLRIDKASKGTPLTMKKTDEIAGPQLKATGKGRLFYDTDWYQNEKFFTEDSPRAGWALVSKNVLPDSTDKNDLKQTEVLAHELSKVFKGMKISKDVQKALKQFEDDKGKIEELLKTNWQEAAHRLSQLDINKLFRRSPVEIIYDLLMVLRNSDKRLLEDRYERTSYQSSRGKLVDLGGFDADGVYVYSWYPHHGDSSFGVSFSRSQ